jgi:hypothetical protein
MERSVIRDCCLALGFVHPGYGTAEPVGRIESSSAQLHLRPDPADPVHSHVGRPGMDEPPNPRKRAKFGGIFENKLRRISRLGRFNSQKYIL